jgi:diadenosine tetraphosphate (Ap4A) HIT family hydrolase
VWVSGRGAASNRPSPPPRSSRSPIARARRSRSPGVPSVRLLFSLRHAIVMSGSETACLLCRGPAGDPELDRVQVWEDAYWRLTTVTEGEVVGFSYLEPKRHVPHITDLEGEEARTLGPVLAKVTRALRVATDAELVYIYVFGGGIPHLHLHLGPHRKGDALNERLIRGEVTETHLPSGATSFVSKEFPPLPVGVHTRALERLHQLLAGSGEMI